MQAQAVATFLYFSTQSATACCQGGGREEGGEKSLRGNEFCDDSGGKKREKKGEEEKGGLKSGGHFSIIPPLRQMFDVDMGRKKTSSDIKNDRVISVSYPLKRGGGGRR